MNKTPEQYFQEQDFATLEASIKAGHAFTPAEQAFMQKYLGVDAADLKGRKPLRGKSNENEYGLGQDHDFSLGPAEEPMEFVLRREEQLLLVGFFIGDQQFTLPTLAVQEVIKATPVARLPSAPDFVGGVINLRGRVTPLIHLGAMLEVSNHNKQKDDFVVICRRRGLQIGLMIEKVHTMYRVTQDSIEWAVEAHLGTSVEYISGLLKINDMLVSIVSIDRVVESILKGYE